MILLSASSPVMVIYYYLFNDMQLYYKKIFSVLTAELFTFKSSLIYTSQGGSRVVRKGVRDPHLGKVCITVNFTYL